MSHPGRLNSQPMKAYLPRILSCMTLLMLPVMLAADVATPHYRVEVIVFTHAEGRSDARDMQQLDDFSALTDPLARARKTTESSADELSRQTELDAVLELIDTLDGLEEGNLMPELPVWPEPYLALERLSPKMERALARLNDSSGHDVLSWRAWHQPLERGSAGERVRIHDDEPVAVDWLKLTPVGIQPVSDLEPTFHYRLDGGVRLRQRQFMHLESNLQWRIEQVASPWMSPLEFHDEPTGGFRVHRLSQSRTIRPGRLEYFDSNWLGMLVLIEPIDPLDGSDADHEDVNAEMD